MGAPVSQVEVLDTPTITEVEEGDHDLFSHYVWPAEALIRSRATGDPCMALCGKVWVPTRNPSNFPVCPLCSDLLGDILAREIGGR